MVVKRASAGSSHGDMLDRLLDRGIVIDARADRRDAGIEIARGHARLRVVAVETCVEGEHRPSPQSTSGHPAISDLTAELALVRDENGTARTGERRGTRE